MEFLLKKKAFRGFRSSFQCFLMAGNAETKHLSSNLDERCLWEMN